MQHHLADKYEAEAEELDPAIRDKFYMLRAADAPAYIKGVGSRMSDNTYWITENEEDDLIVASTSALPKAHLVHVYAPYTKSYETDLNKTFARYGFVPPSQTNL